MIGGDFSFFLSFVDFESWLPKNVNLFFHFKNLYLMFYQHFPPKVGNDGSRKPDKLRSTIICNETFAIHSCSRNTLDNSRIDHDEHENGTEHEHIKTKD